MAVKAKAEITLYKIISVEKVVRYYLLQSSTLAAPSKPADGAVIGSNWSKTEPSYTSGSTSTLYFVDQTVLSNGTLKYSEVSKSSSYEAAKEAWNKANNAQKTADSANSKIDGLQVGGRNMLRGSSFDNQPNVNNTYIKYKNNSVKLTVDNTNGATGTIKYVSISSLTQSWNLSDVIGKTITISMWVYVEKSKQVDGYEFRIVYTHEGNTKWFNPDTKYPYYVPDADKLKVGWNYLYASFTIPSDSTQADFNFTLYARAGKTSTAWFSSPKAEIGNVATDWTPAPEDAIADTYQEYYLSTSQTALSSGSWTTTAPTWANGKYMWSRTVKVDGAGNKTYAPSQNGVCIAGAKGDTGASGKGIKSTAIAYQLSASQTKAPTGTWLSSPPKTDIATPYLWTRTVITYTDNTTSTSYGVSSTLDSLMVGGRNLFKHSSLVGEQLVCDSVNGCNSIDTMKYEDSGYHIVTPNAGNLNNGILFVFKDFTTLGLKKGDTITFSIDVKGTSDEHNPFLKIWLPKEKIDVWWEGTSSNMAEFVPTKEFKRASVTFTIPSSYELSYIFFGVHGNIQSDLYIRNVKLEKGTVATDWTPAPEDLETRVSNAETAISNNAKEIKLKASQDKVTAISDDLKVLTKTSTEFKQTVEGWQLNWDKLISTDNAEVASHQDYITFDKGDIILGESSNDLKLKITNDSIQFKGTSNTEVTPDSDATAWITGKTFHISDGEIQNSLKFGKLYLKPNNENNSVDLYYSDSESDVISGSYVRLGQTISMGNGMGSGFLKLNTGCIQMYPTTLADTNGNGNTGKFELHAGGSYPYIIFGDYNTNDEAKKEKGRYSVRIGGSNTVSGNCSVAIGYSSDVSGKNSTAIGHYLKNISDNQLLIGKYNISSDYPFIIGNGSSDTERSNALTVDWDGNITGKSLTSANDLKLGFGSSNIFKPYFTKGDSITLTIYAVGYVTTGGKEVAMYVPLSRPIIAGGSVSVASVNGLTIRQNGKYLYSSSASNSVNPSSFRAAIVGSGCGVNIVATFGNTVNATVNDVCSITASIKITFS